MVVALGPVAYAVSGSSAGVAAEAATPLPAHAQASPAPSGGAARVESGTDLAVLDRTGAEGVFVVSVRGVRCGVRRLGPVRARGQFCLVEVAAENAGRDAHRLDGGAQRVIDTRGRAYAIGVRAAGVLRTLRQEIAPGATVRGVLPFDVPRGARLSTLVLHESAGSRGAPVALW